MSTNDLINICLEYIPKEDTFRKKYPHIFCKTCDNILIEPVYCHVCGIFSCNNCLITNDYFCCDNETPVKTDRNNGINGVGILYKVLSTLSVSCPINKVHGCEWIGTRSELEKHLLDCQKNYQSCKFGCGVIIHIDDITHMSHCKHYSQWIDGIKSTEEKKENVIYDDKLVAFIKYAQNKLEYQDKIIEKLDKKNKFLSSRCKKISIETDLSKNTQTILTKLILPNENNKWLIRIDISISGYIEPMDDCNRNIFECEYYQIGDDNPVLWIKPSYKIKARSLAQNNPRVRGQCHIAKYTKSFTEYLCVEEDDDIKFRTIKLFVKYVSSNCVYDNNHSIKKIASSNCVYDNNNSIKKFDINHLIITAQTIDY